MMSTVLILSVLVFFTMTTTNSHSASTTLYALDGVHRTYVLEILDGIESGSVVEKAKLGAYFDDRSIDWTSVNLLDCETASGVDKQCLLNKCLPLDDLYHLSHLRDNQSSNQTSAAVILLRLLKSSQCGELEMDSAGSLLNITHHAPPTSAESWGYGILCTTIINLCSLTGVVALPFIHGSVYKKMLVFMVALAVGTLAGSSVLFLIPEALELTDQELNIDSHVWKCLTVLIGIYAFFLIERLLKHITEARERKERTKTEQRIAHCRDRDNTAMSFSSFHTAPLKPNYKDVSDLPKMSPCGDNSESSSSLSEDHDVNEMEEAKNSHKNAAYHVEDDGNDNPDQAEKKPDEKRAVAPGTAGPLVPRSSGHRGHGHHVAPVAWMIIFGDGVHNFIDGVSIGAAFTESILAGLSVSIAILCEELPHELGDFAVLLKAGMKIRRAVLYNFLSATMCYAGLVVGIVLGENTSTHTWVFAFAGGMFLYIALVDMMPEMNSSGEDDEAQKDIGCGNIFLLQNLGLCTGLGIMLALAVYGGALEEAIRGGS